MIWLLLGCGGPSPEALTAFGPILHVVDRDGNGTLSPEEYAAVTTVAPPFAQVDLDGSGALDEAEIAQLVVTQDATRYDPALAATEMVSGPPRPAEAPATRDLLRFVAAEVKARDPAAATPDEQAIQAALRSPEATRAVLVSLHDQAVAAGLRWPPELDPLLVPAVPVPARPPGR